MSCSSLGDSPASEFYVSTHKIQAPGNHPKERIQNFQHSESLKARTVVLDWFFDIVLNNFWRHNGMNSIKFIIIIIIIIIILLHSILLGCGTQLGE